MYAFPGEHSERANETNVPGLTRQTSQVQNLPNKDEANLENAIVLHPRVTAHVKAHPALNRRRTKRSDDMLSKENVPN